MAKSSHKLDEVFKEKLSQHSIKPSALAWERLEKELPQEPKSNKGFWWAAAASVVILLSAGYFFYPKETNQNADNLLAEKQEKVITENLELKSDSNPEQNSIAEIPQVDENEKATEETPDQVQEKPKTETKKQTPSNSQPKITEPTSKNLIALTEAREEEKEKVEVITIEETIETKPLSEPELKLPELDLSKAVAVAEKTQETEEPAYRIKIFSDGLKEEPKDKNLISEIGKTVNEVGGLIGKVDQGFADLQDAKNNLFTNLTSKKERADK